MDTLSELSIKELAQCLQKKQFSSVELTKHCFTKIHEGNKFNAFISIDEEQALIAAHKADGSIAKGEAHALTGIPMALKDLFCTKLMRTTCGSKMLSNFQSPYDATVTNQLLSKGAVLLGKTNMDEFAMGSANENSYFGPVQNPWDTSRVPGGSSGGSAAAVAARMVPYAIGSDTGGSIRQPAAFCGISGIKPTYGLISRYGMVAYASSLDQAGPLAKNASDLSILLSALAGFDERDSTSVQANIPDYHELIHRPIKGLRIGLPDCFFNQEVDPSIQAAIHEAVLVFERMGATIIKLDLKLQPLWVPCYYVIACAEASSNLSRYDGLRFGHQSEHATSLKELITQSRTEGFGLEVQRRILTGTHVLSAGYYDAYYLQAQKIRRMIQEELLTQLKSVDLLLGPTTPTLPFEIGKKADNPVHNYLADVFTVAANLAGLPALSMPVGFSNKLPIGMQLMASHYQEEKLLQAAHQYQLQTNWHLQTPTYNG
jgi:aspartyl-tRNA(Asn)/glutamyl-tRNA(Gln) amidotransferase subunit A